MEDLDFQKQILTFEEKGQVYSGGIVILGWS